MEADGTGPHVLPIWRERAPSALNMDYGTLLGLAPGPRTTTATRVAFRRLLADHSRVKDLREVMVAGLKTIALSAGPPEASRTRSGKRSSAPPARSATSGPCGSRSSRPWSRTTK